MKKSKASTPQDRAWDCWFSDPTQPDVTWYGQLTCDSNKGIVGLFRVRGGARLFEDDRLNDYFREDPSLHLILDGKTAATAYYPTVSVQHYFGAINSRELKLSAQTLLVGVSNEKRDSKWIREIEIRGEGLSAWLDYDQIKFRSRGKSDLRPHIARPITLRRKEDARLLRLTSSCYFSQKGNFDRVQTIEGVSLLKIRYNKKIDLEAAIKQLRRVDDYIALITGHYFSNWTLKIFSQVPTRKAHIGHRIRVGELLHRPDHSDEIKNPYHYNIISTRKEPVIDFFDGFVSFEQMAERIAGSISLFRKSKKDILTIEDRFFAAIRALEGLLRLFYKREDGGATKANMAELASLVASHGSSQLKGFFDKRVANAIRPEMSLATMLQRVFEEFGFLRPHLNKKISDIVRARGKNAHPTGVVDFDTLDVMFSVTPVIICIYNFTLLREIGVKERELSMIFDKNNLIFRDIKKPGSVRKW